jgi:tRNA(fMet)-specific endonuclease VapC
MTLKFMLDTNMVSQLLRGHSKVLQQVTSAPMESLCISAVTEGELAYGLARRPDATRLANTVGEFLRRIEICAWDSDVSQAYGVLRADIEKTGLSLAPLDMMIAAHAQCVGATLVTNDAAFERIHALTVVDWTK